MVKRLAAVALGAAALFAGVALAGLAGGSTRPLVLRAGASPSPLLGIDYAPRQSWLERLSRKTLRALPDRRLRLDEFTGSWSYSPDRSLLALGNQSSTAVTYSPARIRLVDARTLRRVRNVQLGLTGEVTYTYWATADRLLALVQSRDDPGNEGDPPVVTERIVVVDPETGTVRASAKLEGRVAALATEDDALALVLEGSSYGPVRFVVAHGDGRFASVVLEDISAGSRQTSDGPLRQDDVAVTLDRQGARAYVVAAGQPVAEVALATLAVGYHTPTQPVSLLGRLHDWLEPEAQAKGPLEGSWRYAVWLGDGQLAVYGRDMWTYQAADGPAFRERPSGLLVIDTRGWSARMVDPRSSEVVVAADALLSWGTGWDSGTDRWVGTGLGIFDPSGSQVFHLYGRRMISDVQVVGHRAFVARGTGYAIVDVRTGKQLRTIRGRQLPAALTAAGPRFYG
jgi:hypothetical protein